MKTENLIKVLAADEVAPRWPLARAFAVAVACGVAIAATGFFMKIGFRPDIADALGTIRFVFKFVITLSLAVVAMGVVLRLARPGAELGAWRWALMAVPLLLVGAVVIELALVPSSLWKTRLIGRHSEICLTVIPLLSIGPLACLLLALRHAAPTRPGLAGAVAGLVASGIAATLYASNCTDDSPLFVAAWYPLATAIVVLAGHALGRRLIRW